MTDCPYCQLLAENIELKREIEAMKMLMPPPAIPPVPEHPERVVTGIDMDVDPA
jgi:hypothetical protein